MINQNILISSAGRRVSLVRDFKKSLNKLVPGARVFASDLKPHLSAACNYADGNFQVPKISENTFMDVLLTECKKNKIGMIIPTIDTELLVFSANRAKFESEGIHIIISDEQLVYACRNKRLTHELFLKYGISHAEEVDPDTANFPVFSKPEGGSSSIGIHIFHSPSEINNVHRLEPGRMFLEYLDPKDHTEFTVDLYYNKQSECCFCVPRQRIEIRSGEVNKGVTRRNELVDLLRQKLNHLQGARGCITLQVFRNNTTGKITGIEINPRFGGGYPLSYAAGADFPSLLLKEYFSGETIEYSDKWESDLLMLRYDHEVLVHGAEV